MDRRRFLAAASGTVTAAIAGCVDGDGTGNGGTSTATATGTPGSTATETDAAPETDTATETDDSYTVSMEPVGEVTFESVPEVWVANNGSWADMGIALGLEPPEGVWLPNRYHTQYYDDIPGVSVDQSALRELWGDAGVGKEQFYDIDADVHVIDPNFLSNRAKGWDESDVEDIEAETGPFFGNSIFSGGYTWHEDYTYYTLYEAFEKLSQVFQRTDRYEAFTGIHDEFQSAIDDVVPADEERPAVAIMWAGGDEPEEFSPYLISQGTSFKQWRDLRVRDALAETDVQDFHENRGSIDFETLLEIDPEYLMFRGQEAKAAEEFQDTVVQFMKDHNVASALTAVQNDDVYRGGPLYQGPITNLVLTERAAQQVYGVEEELFDRQRVADVVAGDV